MGLFAENDREASSGSGSSRYPKPNKIDLNAGLRFAILKEPMLVYWQLFAENVENPSVVRPFRFTKKPSQKELLTALGGEWRAKEKTKFYQVKGELEAPKKTYAFVIWNYETKQVEILCINQSTIYDNFKEWSFQEEYQDALAWDYQIKRKVEGSGDDARTSYKTMILPRRKDTETEVETALSDLEAECGFDDKELLVNGDPWNPGGN